MAIKNITWDCEECGITYSTEVEADECCTKKETTKKGKTWGDPVVELM